MPSALKKTAETILESGNDCLGALKGNQSGLLKAVKTQFQAQQTLQRLNKGHGRIEKRTICISHILDGIPDFPGLRTLINSLGLVNGLGHATEIAQAIRNSYPDDYHCCDCRVAGIARHTIAPSY